MPAVTPRSTGVALLVGQRPAAVGLERGQRHLAGRGIAEPHVVDLDAAGGLGQVDGVGPVVDRVGEIEDLEDAVEGHERAHDVDPGVGEAR